jgi:FAD:protein FMN transferase
MFGKKIHKTQHWLDTRMNNWWIFIGCFLFVSCSSNTSQIDGFPDKNTQFSGETQGTTYSIITSEDSLYVTKQEVDELLAYFDTSLSSYINQSIVTKFNNADTIQLVFEDTRHFFQTCIEQSIRIHELSNGALDPSLYPLISGWGFLKNPQLEMTEKQVDSLVMLTGFIRDKDFSYKRLSDSTFMLQKHKKDLRFDFNAIAQGLSVDEVVAFLEKKGHSNYFVEIGGELRVKGVNREGQPWRIGVDLPTDSDERNENVRSITSVLHLTEGAVATSGNYRKFYKKNGIKYSHTIDPSTGYPVQHSLLSATVLASNCTLADAFATVFMVMGVEKTKAFLNANQDLGLDVLLIYANEQGEMEKYSTPGMNRRLE